MISIIRTANAGCLVQMDGVRVLLDGVCGEVPPFLSTPPSALEFLENKQPDLVAFTHTHPDHFDAAFCERYYAQTGRGAILPGTQSFTVGAVTIHSVISRHLGQNECIHSSYILEGSSCLWFMGDASPLQWYNSVEIPKPDIIIAPYAYAATTTAWRATKALGASTVILLHLPAHDNDPYGLWNMVQRTLINDLDVTVYIPDILEEITIS